MIRIENLHKTFWVHGKPTVVARGMNATFPARTGIALLGRNGAGKTTLLSMIAGTLRPDQGSITSTGTISWPVGFRGSFHGDLTGAQNTRFVARVYGVDTDALAEFVAEFAELGEHFHMPFRTYSSGMRARLSFAVSMGIRFDTYLIDEVTSVGDAAFRAKSRLVLMDRLQTSGAILVTHSLGKLRTLCSHGAVLDRGLLWYYENVEDAVAHHLEIMRATMGEDADEVTDDD